MTAPDSRQSLNNLPDVGVSAEDIKAFCRDRGLQFYALGRPEDWADNTVFRAGTQTVPSSGVTVPFKSVKSWKAAMAAMGPQHTSDARYRHYGTGKLYEVVGNVMLEAGCVPGVLYKGPDGMVWAQAKSQFFKLEVVNGEFVPRYSYVGPISPVACPD